MTRLLIAALVALPGAALAVGSDSNLPPKPTETSTECRNGMVWDSDIGRCVRPSSSSLDDDTLYGAVREFAYAGQFGEALGALDAMSDQGDDRVLTYRGFVHRSLGEVELGMAYYRQAIARNPDNLLARSYMGQGMAEQGDMAAARLQLAEIRMRGGAGGWPAEALAKAIETGRSTSY